jgi:hypothetical protein
MIKMTSRISIVYLNVFFALITYILMPTLPCNTTHIINIAAIGDICFYGEQLFLHHTPPVQHGILYLSSRYYRDNRGLYHVLNNIQAYSFICPTYIVGFRIPSAFNTLAIRLSPYHCDAIVKIHLLLVQCLY